MSDIKFNEINKLVKEIGEKHSSAPKGFAFTHRNQSFISEDSYGVNAEEFNKSIFEVTKSPLYEGGKFRSESVTESILSKLSPEPKKFSDDVEKFATDAAQDLAESLTKNKSLKNVSVKESAVEFQYRKGTYQFNFAPKGSRVEVIAESFGNNPKEVDKYFTGLVHGRKFDPTKMMYSTLSESLSKHVELAVQEAALDGITEATGKLTMSKTYQVVTPESAEHGDADDHGFEYEDQEFDSIEDLADEIQSEGSVEASSYPVRKPYEGTWFSSVDPDLDYQDGSETTYSFHPEGLSDEQWEELFKLLGIKVSKTESSVSEQEEEFFTVIVPEGKAEEAVKKLEKEIPQWEFAVSGSDSVNVYPFMGDMGSMSKGLPEWKKRVQSVLGKLAISIGESKIAEREGTGFVENYPDLAKKLKATIQKVIDKVDDKYSGMTYGDDEPKEVEHKSRDGFFSSNDGGYEQSRFANALSLQGSAPHKEVEDAIADIEMPEGEDEDLPEEDVMFQIKAFVDFRGGPSWTIQGAINWEHPYFRPGKGNEVFKEIEVEFDDLEDMKKNFNKVLVAVAKCGKFLMGEEAPGKVSEASDQDIANKAKSLAQDIMKKFQDQGNMGTVYVRITKGVPGKVYVSGEMDSGSDKVIYSTKGDKTVEHMEAALIDILRKQPILTASGDIAEQEDDFKKLDRLQMEIQKLMKSGSDEDWKKAMELKKEADALFSKLYDVRSMKEAEEDFSDMYEIVDMGWENPSYFQGFGTFGSKWDEAIYEVGYSIRDAVDQLIGRIHELDVSEAVKDAIASELEADLVKAGKEADKDWYDHSGDERPEDGDEPIEGMMYHVGVRVKKDKGPRDGDDKFDPLAAVAAHVKKREVKEDSSGAFSYPLAKSDIEKIIKLDPRYSISKKDFRDGTRYYLVIPSDIDVESKTNNGFQSLTFSVGGEDIEIYLDTQYESNGDWQLGSESKIILGDNEEKFKSLFHKVRSDFWKLNTAQRNSIEDDLIKVDKSKDLKDLKKLSLQIKSFLKSESKSLSTPDKHQLKILKDTVKNPEKSLLGGPTAAEAKDLLKKKFKYTDQQIADLEKSEEIKESSERPKIFGYYINKDERGEFAADVRDESGETVWETDGDVFEDGFMKNKSDIAGLEKYLVSLGIMKKEDQLMGMREFEEYLEGLGKWIIHDWAGNHVFKDQEFETFDDAEAWLDEKLGDDYETDRQEYEIIKVESKDPSSNKKVTESVGSDKDYNYAVKIDGVSSDFYKAPFGRQIDDLKKIKEFQSRAKKDHIGSKGKATLGAVKAWIKSAKPKQYFARWKKDSSSYKDDSVEIFYMDGGIEEAGKFPHMGFDKLAAKLKRKGVDDPEALAASILRKKYGKKTFQAAAAAGMKESSGVDFKEGDRVRVQTFTGAPWDGTVQQSKPRKGVLASGSVEFLVLRDGRKNAEHSEWVPERFIKKLKNDSGSKKQESVDTSPCKAALLKINFNVFEKKYRSIAKKLLTQFVEDMESAKGDMIATKDAIIKFRKAWKTTKYWDTVERDTAATLYDMCCKAYGVSNLGDKYWESKQAIGQSKEFQESRRQEYRKIMESFKNK